jgi:formamidopyrimidine-DNA glycosylase
MAYVPPLSRAQQFREALSSAFVQTSEVELPELPEVETMVRGIRPYVAGRKLTRVERCRTKCRPITLTPAFPTLSRRVQGRTVTQVRRWGKRVAFEFDTGATLTIEPRMTGLVLLADPPDPGHLRLKFEFDGDWDYNEVWFWDRRGLGTIRLYGPGELERHLLQSRLGTDALTFTPDDWQRCCGKTARAIKVVLLDQKAVAGIGNLYASEILHHAGIHPGRAADSLKKGELQKLHAATKAILEEAIRYEGSTLGDGTYRNALNKAGGYQNVHRVYQKHGQPCSNCRRGVIERIIQAQRSTFFCPRCQR